MTEQIVVLGWDALDIELLEKYGIGDAFGANRRKIETHVNPVIDEPHTRECWPSMLTGVTPDEHGIHAVTEDDGLDWDNGLIDTASSLANGVVPQQVLDAIGRQLRERGARLNQKDVSYYDDTETVFDDLGDGRAISVPNYETAFDRDNGLDATRDGVWGELLVDRDGRAGFTPAIDSPGMYDVLGAEAGRRVGHTLSAMHTGEPLVWTWFGLIDTVGHMAPTVPDPLEKHWYEYAASVTRCIRDMAPPETTVLVVSDHGLQDGEHTDYATVCCDRDIATLDSIFDIRRWISAQRPTGHDAAGEADATVGEVHEQLERLGYV